MSCRWFTGKSMFAAAILCMVGSMQAGAQSPTELNVMPLPAKAQLGSGALKIDAGFTLAFTGYREERLDRAGRRFLLQCNRETGLVFGQAAAAADP
ncbi:MAG TPA: hypothetical protein VJ255_06845, partial [Candidatus Acidoferrum sp.]|nr:hypothetical protein [Candidatus Acidoferrum sp.]